MKIQLLLNLFIRHFGSIPFDFKLSKISCWRYWLYGGFFRSLSNGVRFGAFANKDVSFRRNLVKEVLIKEYFLISRYMVILLIIHGGHSDPGARLNRRNSLHDLLLDLDQLINKYTHKIFIYV